jgi:hypothetical protein
MCCVTIKLVLPPIIWMDVPLHIALMLLVTLSPVLHVNADDVEAVVHAMSFALDYKNAIWS